MRFTCSQKKTDNAVYEKSAVFAVCRKVNDGGGRTAWPVAMESLLAASGKIREHHQDIELIKG
jgi:hypothetical protein